jgi:hypothetical protein
MMVAETKPWRGEGTWPWTNRCNIYRLQSKLCEIVLFS